MILAALGPCLSSQYARKHTCCHSLLCNTKAVDKQLYHPKYLISLDCVVVYSTLLHGLFQLCDCLNQNRTARAIQLGGGALKQELVVSDSGTYMPGMYVQAAEVTLSSYLHFPIQPAVNCQAGDPVYEYTVNQSLQSLLQPKFTKFNPSGHSVWVSEAACMGPDAHCLVCNLSSMDASALPDLVRKKHVLHHMTCRCSTHQMQ